MGFSQIMSDRFLLTPSDPEPFLLRKEILRWEGTFLLLRGEPALWGEELMLSLSGGVWLELCRGR